VSLQARLPPETYSRAEILVAVQSLTVSNKTALIRVARAYARKTSYGHEDLIQEAYMRVLDGKRGWPKNVAAVPFLCGVMRSIAWDWRPEDHDENADVELIGYVRRVAEPVDRERIHAHWPNQRGRERRCYGDAQTGGLACGLRDGFLPAL
jgi:DNA-directed RNA polymerase specialized sigma24 family protein